MATQQSEVIEQVLSAIEANEGTEGSRPCDNSTIVDVTGVPRETVAKALEQLWAAGRIEGILGLRGDKPTLNGIVRVLPGRTREWYPDGYYVKQP